MYQHDHQYRCTIIRGKSQKEIDDLLPAYALIISDICPCSKEIFDVQFNERLKKYLPADKQTDKTLKNHRTEIAGKLFGMYYASSQDDDATVYPAERTLKYLEDNDQPAFFKDVCYKMQFPNGMSKPSNAYEEISNQVSIRQYCYLLKVLLLAKYSNLTLTKSDIGYYILNNLDVLQRKATPAEVIEQIFKDRKNKIERKVHTEGKASSYDVQHINEQINYLELANLIIINDRNVSVNPNEMETIELFADEYNSEPMFNCLSYDFDTVDGRKQFLQKWNEYFAKLSSVADKFRTSVNALAPTPKEKKSDTKKSCTGSKVVLGDEGEEFIFEYEKKRVSAFNVRLANKVIALGKQKGLGYDIQSVIAEPGDRAEFVKYIEVKSTKRVTAPDIDSTTWLDTLNITRNEYIAAQQHGDYYAIYRVYFTRDGVTVFVINNLWRKCEDNKVEITPLTYRVDFSNIAVDSVLDTSMEDKYV